MKKINICLLAAFILTAASCEKQEFRPSKPDHHNKIKQCRMCEGGWDITDTIP